MYTKKPSLISGSIFYMVLSIFLTSQVFAFCMEPSLPDAVTIMKPNVPFCLSDYKFSGTHECSQWDLDSYTNEVDNYIKQLNQYARDSVDFANEAQAYARCLAEEAKNEL